MSESEFLVSARKYRPQLFSELVAQEHVSDTMKNAIRLDRLAHAYLFTGPRGVGKTTAARILAKAINCTTPTTERADADEPCRRCDSCRSFEEGRNLNILEIDAASNNGVDDIRNLRETVRIPPQGNRKKVYIVDEVHMLSPQAFNALLKTLEEPPSHALFIFATTEPHKVLATVQSRCQRFDFRRIPVPDIVAHLRGICEAESISADDDSLMLLARKADGALRDALSVFDQAVSLCGTDLQINALTDALGLVGEDLYFELSAHVASGSAPSMMRLVDRIVGAGYDIQEFLDGVAEHFRNLLVAVTLPDTSLIAASEATRGRYKEQSAAFDEGRLMRMLAIVDDTLDRVRTSRQPRLRLELALLKMAAMPSTVDLKRALAMLDGTEPLPAVHLPAAGMPPPLAAAASAEPASGEKAPEAKAVPAPPDPSDARKASKPEGAPAPESEVAEPDKAPAPEIQVAEPDKAPAPKPEASEPNQAPAPEDQSPPEPPGPPSSPDPTSSPAPAPPPRTAPQLDFGSTDPRSTRNVLGQPALFSPPKPRPDQPKDAAETSDVAVAELPEGEAPPYWDAFVTAVMDEKIHVGALLQHASAAVKDEVLYVAVPESFSARMLHEDEELLLRALRTVHPAVWKGIRCTIQPAQPSEDDDVLHDAQASLQALCEEYPALRTLMERFGGEIVW